MRAGARERRRRRAFWISGLSLFVVLASSGGCSEEREPTNGAESSGGAPQAGEGGAIAAAGGGAAGAAAAEAAGAGGVSECVARLQTPLLEHVCQHVLTGPFAALVAPAEGTSAAIDRTHVAYTVALPAEDASGAVTLRVANGAGYAVFVSHELPLTVSAEGVPAEVLHEQDVPSCDDLLVRAQVFALEPREPYELRLGPGADSVVLVLEELDPVADWLRSCDGEPVPGEPDPCEDGSDECECAPLRAACIQSQDCCSGRCYARECVALECRTDGYCQSDDECCEYCHQTQSPHCH